MVRVMRAKLVMIPRVIPSGLRCPPLVVADKIIGNNGQMHGAKIVTSPEIKAKTSNTPIRLIRCVIYRINELLFCPLSGFFGYFLTVNQDNFCVLIGDGEFIG